jgi:class 3 adenylate cyclase
MDESTAMAMATGDDLRMTSDVYCNTISACRNLGDYQRAEEWTEEAERWMRSHGVVGYTGACQVHRAELKRLHGSWPEAEEEARRACVELEKYRLNDYLGSAFYEIGEVRRRMGDWTAADDAFNQAFENGHDAQPGVSLLALDRGEVETAMKSISKALEKKEMGPSPNSIRGPSRARLLPSLIEIALASGEGELAKSAVDELDLIAEMYESSVWQAWVVASRGAVLAYEKRHTEAVDELRRAWRMWQGADLPYEAARTRLLLGEVLKASGDDLGARRELQAALSTFEQLGARHDVARAQLVLGVPASEKSDGSMSQVTRTFMFTDIVTSTDLIGLIGDASWQELLRWHDRTLRSAIAKNGGEEVRHTGDGFFVAFADPHSGVDCAVDIQRQLASHRRQHGFAPLVRIGLHTAEATLQDGDYSGGGVHASARVGALAEGEQIVVSAQVVVAAGAIPYPLSESRTVSLKGIAEPLEVHTLDWR